MVGGVTAEVMRFWGAGLERYLVVGGGLDRAFDLVRCEEDMASCRLSRHNPTLALDRGAMFGHMWLSGDQFALQY